MIGKYASVFAYLELLCMFFDKKNSREGLEVMVYAK